MWVKSSAGITRFVDHYLMSAKARNLQIYLSTRRRCRAWVSLPSQLYNFLLSPVVRGDWRRRRWQGSQSSRSLGPLLKPCILMHDSVSAEEGKIRPHCRIVMTKGQRPDGQPTLWCPVDKWPSTDSPVLQKKKVLCTIWCAQFSKHKGEGLVGLPWGIGPTQFLSKLESWNFYKVKFSVHNLVWTI